MTVKIGTSGWQYRHWRTAFYPEGLAAARWLGYYADRFDTVELNNAFYGLPEAAAFERWRDATPDGFEMSVKMSSYLTHNRRLREPSDPVRRFMDRARGLGPKLGPVLLQLPPTMRVETGRLERALACFDHSVRVAVEAPPRELGLRRRLEDPDRPQRGVGHRGRTLAPVARRAHGGLGLPPLPCRRRLSIPVLRAQSARTMGRARDRALAGHGRRVRVLQQ